MRFLIRHASAAEAVARLHQVRRADASTQEIETVYKERHLEIGARLMRQWQLPEALEHPVRYHHDPEACASHKG